MRLQVSEDMHYYCISEMVANYLQKYIQYRKRRIFYAEHNSFEELLPYINRKEEGKMMIVLSDVHSDDVINLFSKKGIELTPAIMYRTVPVKWQENEPFDHDMVVLFTPTGVNAVKQNFPDLKQGDKIFACFGANTAAALREIGIEPDIQAPSPQFPGITSAIKHYLEHNNK